MNTKILRKFGIFMISNLQETSKGSVLRTLSRNFTKHFLKKFKSFKFRKTIKHAYSNSPFYRKLFKENGVKPGSIETVGDLNDIPFTYPKDLQKFPRSFLAVPERRIARVFTTAGTTGEPKRVYLTKEDIERMVLINVLGMRGFFGLRADDVVRLSLETGYGNEIWGIRDCVDAALNEIGSLTIASELQLENELEIFEEYKPTVLSDVTSRIWSLTRELGKKRDLKSLGVKKILVGGEPTPDRVRNKIEKRWAADVFKIYGMTEIGPTIACECEEKNGMHLSEISVLVEVVDPDTGKPLPDRKVGELVFTTLDRVGMPLIRYRTRDLGKIVPGSCSCGVPLKKIKIKGRVDDLTTIGGGDNIFTWMFDEVILTLSEIDEYKVQLNRENGKDQITIIAESRERNKTVRKKVAKAVTRLPKIRNGIEKSNAISKIDVNLVKPGTFERKSIKRRRVVDERELYD